MPIRTIRGSAPGKIKFGSILGCIDNCQNIVTSGRKWRSENPKFVCFPMEGLFSAVCAPTGPIYKT